jgi:hypothetical protein
VHVRVEQMMDCGDSMSSGSFEEARQSLGIAKMTQAERPRDAGSFRNAHKQELRDTLAAHRRTNQTLKAALRLLTAA